MKQRFWETVRRLAVKLVALADTRLVKPQSDNDTYTAVWSEGDFFMWSDDEEDVTYTVTVNDEDSSWSVTTPPEWHR